jgi:hypothetical protein
MKNYIIEGDVDFMKELKLVKSNLVNSIPNTKNSAESNNICLITNEPLTNYCVTLACAHRFNYLPLYFDILTHKKKSNTLESTMLSDIQIRCPYCRNIQSELLPYYNIPDVKKVHGVNWFNENFENKKQGEMIGVCEYKDECSNTLVALWQNGHHYCAYHTCKMVCLKSENMKMLQQKYIEDKKLAIIEKQKVAAAKKAALEAKKIVAQEKKAALEAKKEALVKKKAEAQAKKEALAVKKAEAQAKKEALAVKKAEAQAKKAEAQAKKEAKKAEKENKQ